MVREYIWLADEEGGAALPLAVVSDVNTTAPSPYYVHADHLNRPVMMTDASKGTVWSASYLPFGGEYQTTGTASFDARFPGQWYQLESGLSYNWHRQYDASLGRYIQPDPLGFVDGPNRYAYAVNSPQVYVDEDGRQSEALPGYQNPANPKPGRNTAGSYYGFPRVANPSLLNQYLQKCPTSYFRAGDVALQLNQSGWRHILSRHHPRYWDGSVKSAQTFFGPSVGAKEIQQLIGAVVKQNAGALRAAGNSSLAVTGSVAGKSYRLGVCGGEVKQFFPLP